MGTGHELVERAGQLAELDALWSSVRERGRGRVVALGGEAGAGKTTLVRRFCDAALGAPLVLRGGCDPLFTARPLGPFIDIAATSPATARAIAGGGRPDDVVSAVLGDAATRPAVIVVEDAHWADGATLDTLRLLARRIDRSAVLILVTYREEEVHRSHPLRVFFGELGGDIVRIRVPVFSEDAVRTLTAGTGLDPRALHRKTGGNPFFVTEVLATGSIDIPDTVRDAVLARAARLGPECRPVLEATAVSTPHAEVWLLERIDSEAMSYVERCIRSGILHAEGDAVSFRHELARMAIEESTYPWRRTELHRSVASALSSPPAGDIDLARLAHHAEEGGDADAVLKYAPAAAAEAAALGSHREAAAQYERAVRHADGLSNVDRAHLLDAMSQACHLADRGADAIERGHAAAHLFEQAGDPLRAAETLLRLSNVETVNGRPAAALTSLTRALELLEQLPAGRELAMAYANLAGIAMRHGDARQTFEAGARALELAHQVDDPRTLIRVLTVIGTMEMEAQATLADGRRKLEEAIALAEAGAHDDLLGLACNNLTHEAFASQDLALADRTIGVALTYYTERPSELWVHCALGARAELELSRGHWDAAAETARRVLERTTARVLRMGPLVVLGLLRARRGDPQAWEALDEALAIADPDELQMIAPVRAARAEVAWIEGRPELVLTETDEIVDRAVRSNDQWALGEIAYWRWRAGARESIAPDDGSPRRLQISGAGATAAERWERLGYPYETALALADTGGVDHLRTALDRFRALGADAMASVIARQLRDLGVRNLPRGPRRTTAAHPAGLTNREVDVALLVAEGLRDAEIAARLHLSQKTVGHHVSAILRKLDARTRAQIASEVARMGLADAQGA